MWRERIHHYLVNWFLNSPAFHRFVAFTKGANYTAQVRPDSALFRKLRNQEHLVAQRRRRMFWQLFKQEMRYELFPYRRK